MYFIRIIMRGNGKASTIYICSQPPYLTARESFFPLTDRCGIRMKETLRGTVVSKKSI